MRREQAIAAVGRRDWQAAYDLYAGLSDRTADDTQRLAESAWWLGRMDESIRIYADAYRQHLESGSKSGAARSALLLAISCRLVGEAAQSDGWLGRCARLLDTMPEGAEHGYALYLRIAALMGSDPDAALESSRRMQDLGRRFADPTLVCLGVYYEGRSSIKQGRVRDGLALLDEAMLSALSDELAPMWAGAIYCGLMDACHELRDLRRAFEWTEATRRWCEPLPLTSLYPGICRVHRAQVLQTRGDWKQAEEEALGACRDMVGVDVWAVADAHYEIGEVRRLRGDLAGAETAYTQANEFGRDPQPGLALLRLAQGRVEAATASIAAALAPEGGSRLGRAPLHAAQSEIALAAGDLALAEASAQEVADTAVAFESAGLGAEGNRCRGAVLLAQGRAVEAMALLRTAFNTWQELDAPYDAARTRLLIAAAYLALGDADAAAREKSAAEACFARLGVVATREGLPKGLTAREVEVVRLIAAGDSNRSIAEKLVLSEKTVARHVSNIFGKVGATSRSGVTAFAYDNGIMGTNTHG
ncbi:LuxR C-terminal-related transcriptional regulator [Nocardioides sp. HM23]|uniref:LuxR C-terminal-related transcriptional regulator n=1 Tax=Nocardioides bizhenqiangii TaxID=3095076 RepID=UPI002ACA80BB|nr:LuxR C-terminal-related transcriptional regulator [Nocardioides sp. HM23]MDZ5620055.1 LuxR C-terminal-related transcriptional regulator [Nocardioides sp. HM23]